MRTLEVRSWEQARIIIIGAVTLPALHRSPSHPCLHTEARALVRKACTPADSLRQKLCLACKLRLQVWAYWIERAPPNDADIPTIAKTVEVSGATV